MRFSAWFGWGFYPFYWDPYWYGAWGGYPGYWWDQPAYYEGGYGYDEGSLKLSVTPKDAEVFVDQRFAGVVDDFDGFLQRLKVEAGGHTITLYREGYRTVSREIDFRSGETFRLTFSMVALQPGEAPEPRPVPPASPERLPRSAWREPAETGAAQPPVPAAPREPKAAPPVDRPAAANFGALAIRVQPAGAELLIDGEAWQGADGTSRLVVQLPPGVHRVEIRKAGSETFSTEVRIEPGETTTLNVSLSGVGWH